MSLAIVRSNCLFLRSPPDKEARIWYLPELTDGVMMSLLVTARALVGLNRGETSVDNGIGKCQGEGLSDGQKLAYSKGFIIVGVEQG